MKCPRCQHENRSEAKFCEECATPLARTCANCGNPLSATAKFCPECAHPVAAATPADARFASPESYTPKHLAEKILTSKSRPGRRAQAGDGALRRSRRARWSCWPTATPRRREDSSPGPRADDGGRSPLRGHGESGDGRRDHGALRRALAHEDHAVRGCYAALRMQEAIEPYAEEVRRSHAAVSRSGSG